MSGYYEARQHLNLSNYAVEIVESDKSEFLEKPSKAKIINMIIGAFMDDADAAIGNAAVRYREDLQARLSSIPDNQTKYDVIESLVNTHCKSLQEKAFSYPKEHQFKVQLNEENYVKVHSWRDTGGYYSDNVGLFLKAVIEEYARKSFYEREAILLREMIDRIQDAINGSHLLVITLRSGTRFEVKPFRVCGDSEYNYHYLVGYSRKEGGDTEERPVSFRLSRIKDIHRSHSRSGKITKIQKAEISKRLHDVGVQFLLQEPESISLKLTAQGKKMYESQAHLRPGYLSRFPCEDGSWIYEFSCTQMQAEFYFFKFGSHAQILAPAELFERFKSNYCSAATHYLNSEST